MENGEWKMENEYNLYTHKISFFIFFYFPRGISQSAYAIPKRDCSIKMKTVVFFAIPFLLIFVK